MLVSYSSSSEEETEHLRLGGNVTKRKQSWHKDDNSLRKKHKSEEHTLNASVSVNREEDDSKSRLPVPGSVLDMFTEENEDPLTDDSMQHGGRIRSFKHERGNWATYVYFPYIPEEGFLELLDEMTEVAASHSFSLTHTDEFHLSLSKTVVLRHHWIQPFIQSLRTGLTHSRRFICLAEKLKVYSNDERTRMFLAMEVSTGQAQLLELVKAVDSTMEEFNLDTFYKNPSFHISLAWCVGDCTEHIRKKCLQELQGLVDSHEDGPFLLRLDCQELRCKAGNKTFSIPLH
ncbi:U6 snRNA phosphodiesterase isoform X1 [Oncorhynchus tshawytscha]|uniref:U6 snRNA phosphodiesterase n=1 Tax=Oncorhynchus tshawytscha TaxID=74940 RepID=A0AAZ3NXI2_ONCTS|nr:U6 snRNA phosphodiesterase isoform X1 [Oncorhynchus tshawytscha]